ncbi:hypothetical protein QFZ22_000303 [Streptomyces canus]|uniref:Uncharacterized protein n=1 Tax=Streptomyces canus TaxID=58343 RepID=A0AAW8F3F7_9ACTN|nr:hypothetical protein [Streptomyces canus]
MAAQTPHQVRPVHAYLPMRRSAANLWTYDRRRGNHPPEQPYNSSDTNCSIRLSGTFNERIKPKETTSSSPI